MQHDHVLNKLTFYLLTASPGSGLLPKYLLPCSTFHDSNKFDMQHDHVLRKINFGLWTLSQGKGGGMCRCAHKIIATMLLHS